MPLPIPPFFAAVLRLCAGVMMSLLLLNSCRSAYAPDTPPDKVIKNGVVVTVNDQKLSVLRDGKAVRTYDVSTSKFGLGSSRGSYKTPTGVHAVASKVGGGMPKGMVFHGARPTGEIVPPDAPGRDPIVSRIIQLDGLERNNSNSYARRIYIHGTAEERTIGRPSSYGCIRMKSNDVIDLFDIVSRGEPVAIETCSQKTYLNAIADPNSELVMPGQNVMTPQKALAMRTPRRSSYRSRVVRNKGARRARVTASGRKSSKPKKKKRTRKSGSLASAIGALPGGDLPLPAISPNAGRGSCGIRPPTLS